MYQDYKDLLSAFNAHGVRYLIVGGYAVIFHAQPRFTKDIGIFIKADRANAQATWAALAEFGRTEETWLRMQLAYDLAAARKDESKIKVRRQHVPQELHMH
jgi:hypothetical protein